MIELHFKESRLHTRHSARASLCSRSKRSRPERGPTKQTQSEGSKRDGDSDLAAKQQKPGKQQRGTAADPTQHERHLFGIGLNERTGGPQQQKKGHHSKQKFRHGYFSCSISLATPPPCALRSARALSPPAAYAAAARKSSASSCAAPGAKRQYAP